LADPAAKRPAAKRGKTKRQPPRGVRKAVKKATRGDRPYLMGLVLLAFVLMSMAWAPIKNLAAGSARIDQLTASRDALAHEVDKLEERKDELMDPEQLELIAREEYGLVKPGEIPYVVVTPEADPRLRPVDEAPEVAEVPWYRRVWSAIRRLWE
ncbi:MAG TPA: septum formation initiator family protein, partial [Egibacteraceae bacterium]|nr:septum formation initiator family protein [Egibacteraceae bacterium]